MRKVLLLPALALAVMSLLAGAGPAQAAGPYTIATHSPYPYSPVVMEFERQSCNTAVLSSPLNGLDARIVDVSAFAGKTVTIAWKSAASPVSPLGVAGIVRAYTSSCSTFFPSTDWTLTKSSMRLSLPSSSKWLAVFGQGSVNVTFTIR